jgi:maltodextrin utilization protein YvdJ
VLGLLGGVATFNGCSLFGLKGGYSFTGASIPANATTFSVAYINNNTADFPTLANALTEGLRDRFMRQTRLSQVAEDGDLAFEGEITAIVDAPAAMAAADGLHDAGASVVRTTVTVQIMFTNALQPELSFTQRQSFSDYAEYNALTSMRSNEENRMIEEIVEKLVDKIFMASVAQW